MIFTSGIDSYFTALRQLISYEDAKERAPQCTETIGSNVGRKQPDGVSIGVGSHVGECNGGT